MFSAWTSEFGGWYPERQMPVLQPPLDGRSVVWSQVERLKWSRTVLALDPAHGVGLGRGLLSRVGALWCALMWGSAICLEEEILAAVTFSASGDGVQSIDVSVVELICIHSPHNAGGVFFTIIALTS